jgi:Staphylococcal nuclease homologue
MGFSNVVRGQDETVTSSTPETVTGYIYTRAADLYGRCIALVGRGDPPHDDGSSVFVDVDALRTTANHHLIQQGLAYPTYYRALFPDLRNELTAAAKQARDGGLGVWASDETISGFDVTGLDVLQDDIVIVPEAVPPPPRLSPSRGRLDGRVPRVPRSSCRQVLHSVHRALDNRAGRRRGSHRQHREDDPTNRRPRLRREMTVRPPSGSSR